VLPGARRADRLRLGGRFSTAFYAIAGEECRKAATRPPAFSKNAGNQPGRFIQRLNITR